MDGLPWLEPAGRPPPDYISAMCGRIIQSGGPLRYAIVDGLNARDSRVQLSAPVERGAEPGAAGDPSRS
jgi:hypothetical protein